MPTTVQDTPLSITPELAQLTASFDAMHLAQLSAFAFAIPQLYFCREYLELDEQTAVNAVLQRLQKGITEQQFSLERLAELLAEREFFGSKETRLRLAPEPDSWEEIASHDI